jgi:hypothetical protein
MVSTLPLSSVETLSTVPDIVTVESSSGRSKKRAIVSLRGMLEMATICTRRCDESADDNVKMGNSRVSCQTLESKGQEKSLSEASPKGDLSTLTVPTCLDRDNICCASGEPEV